MIGKLFRFLAAGLPAFLIALPLNWFLVSAAHWPKPLAYAIVLWAQLTINFYFCFYWVFERRTSRPSFSQYWKLLSGVAIARGADWVLYTLLTELAHAPYLAVQLLNVFVFALLKYRISEAIFEGHPPASEPRAEDVNRNHI